MRHEIASMVIIVSNERREMPPHHISSPHFALLACAMTIFGAAMARNTIAPSFAHDVPAYQNGRRPNPSGSKRFRYLHIAASPAPTITARRLFLEILDNRNINLWRQQATRRHSSIDIISFNENTNGLSFIKENGGRYDYLPGLHVE